MCKNCTNIQNNSNTGCPFYVSQSYESIINLRIINLIRDLNVNTVKFKFGKNERQNEQVKLTETNKTYSTFVKYSIW